MIIFQQFSLFIKWLYSNNNIIIPKHNQLFPYLKLKQYTMQQQQQSIDILCVGQPASGKTTFLQNYTKQLPDDDQYKIFIKKTKFTIVYLHQVQQEEQIYIDQQYKGILFFVDLVNSINAQYSVLKWIDLYSKIRGKNIFKIPIKVIALKGNLLNDQDLIYEKNNLIKQFTKILEPSQIIFWDNQNSSDSQDLLNQYYQSLCKCSKHELGIKTSPYVIWKLYGFWQLMQSFWLQIKCYYFRNQQTISSPCKAIKKKIAEFKLR